jgi:hypothetical protein
MKKSEINDQYLTKTVISARSQNFFDLRILPLYVFTRVCVCSTTKKKRSQAKFAFDAVDAASHISIVESTLTQFCECIITLFEMQLIVVDSACFAVFKYINYILICDD